MVRTERPFRICFSGHRPNKLGGYDDNDFTRAVRTVLKQTIDSLIQKHIEVQFISGMAVGVDIWSAVAVLEARLTKPEQVTLQLAIPFVGQYANWPLSSQRQYLDIYRQADSIHYVDEEGYAAWKLLNRNKWMVDNSDMVVAVWNGDEDGGTAHCIKYAQRKGKEIINLWNQILTETTNTEKIL